MRISPTYVTFGNANTTTNTIKAKKGSLYLGDEANNPSIKQEQSLKKARLSGPKDGIKTLEELHNKGLGTQETLSLLAEFKNAVGDFDGAINAGIEAYKINPDLSPELYFQLGKAYAGLKDPLCAIKEYTLAINQNPQYVEAIIARAEVRAIHQLFPTAIKDFTEAIILLEIKEKNLKAEKMRDNSVKGLKEIRTQIVDLYMTRGVLKYDNADKDGALADFSIAVERDPSNLKAIDASIKISLEKNNIPRVKILAKQAKDICERLSMEARNRRDRIVQEKYNSEVAKYLKLMKGLVPSTPQKSVHKPPSPTNYTFNI